MHMAMSDDERRSPRRFSSTMPLILTWWVSRQLSVVAVTGMLNRFPSSSMKSMLAVNDKGLAELNVTVTGRSCFAIPIKLPYREKVEG